MFDMVRDELSAGTARQTTIYHTAFVCKNPRAFRLVRGCFLFQYVFQTHFQNGLHMIVCQRVKDVLSLPAEFDELHLL